MSAPVAMQPCPVAPCRGVIGQNGIVCAECAARVPAAKFRLAAEYAGTSMEAAYRSDVIREATTLFYDRLSIPSSPEAIARRAAPSR